MLITNTLEVPQPLDAVWTFFGDIPQVAACLPGANLTDQVGENRYEGDVVIKAGEYSYGGDQGCITTPDGRRGHLSAQVGDEPCVQLIIQRHDDAWRNAPPGFFQ